VVGAIEEVSPRSSLLRAPHPWHVAHTVDPVPTTVLCSLMSAAIMATRPGCAPPLRRRSATAVGTGRPRTGGGVIFAAPTQEVDIPSAYTLTPADGAGQPTRALHHFVVTRLRASSSGPAGLPASLCELDEPGVSLAAGGVLMAPGLPPLTVSLPGLTRWSVEFGAGEARLVASTSTGRYHLVGRAAGSYVGVHGHARRRFELLVRSVTLATRLPPADATYAKIVRQLGRRAAGMRAYPEADVLAEAPFLLAQSRLLEDPALRCSLFAQELARRSGQARAAATRRSSSPCAQLPATSLATSSLFTPMSSPVRPSAAKPPTPPRAVSPGNCRGSLSPRRMSLSPPAGTPASTLPMAMRQLRSPGSPVTPPGSPRGQPSAVALPKKRKRVSIDVAGSSRRPRPATLTDSLASSASESRAAPLCACAGAPGGCGGASPAAPGSKYASDACGMARARQRVAEMASAGVDVDSFVRQHVEPFSA